MGRRHTCARSHTEYNAEAFIPLTSHAGSSGGAYRFILSDSSGFRLYCRLIVHRDQINPDSGYCAFSCWQDNVHARRKLHDLYANHRSEIAEEGLRYFAALYEIEREARELKLDADGRHQLRKQRSKPIAEALRQWLTRQRGQVPDGSATAKAIDYSLGRWAALTRYLEDGDLPIDNNHVENRIRPVALGRSNWLFAGSQRAGERAANVMSLIQSAKLNGHDPYRYLKDVLERLPTQRASQLEELLPHRWQPRSVIH
jgi:transposase